MANLILLLYVVPWLTIGTCMEVINETAASKTNSSDPKKDLYVIHAMVYQVGILTNRTDNVTENVNTTGHQEALTFYHNNGSEVDLSQIPEPLLTNVTAQSVVGVAPVSGSEKNQFDQLPWSALRHLPSLLDTVPALPDRQMLKVSKQTSAVPDKFQNGDKREAREFDNFYQRLFKRRAAGSDSTVAINKGAAVIPKGLGVQSIALPPLLTLNNNFSQIPVPIPNTSIVHYSKINTLVTKP